MAVKWLVKERENKEKVGKGRQMGGGMKKFKTKNQRRSKLEREPGKCTYTPEKATLPLQKQGNDKRWRGKSNITQN